MSIAIIGSVLLNVIKAILPTAADVGKVVLGNKAQQSNNNAEADRAAQESFGKEFSYPLGEQRSRFDAFMDGVNRTPRPVITYGVFALIAWACIDPDRASVTFAALARVPEMIWNIALLVVGFFFTSRMIEKVRWAPYRHQPAAQPAPQRAAKPNLRTSAASEDSESDEPEPLSDSAPLIGAYGIASHRDELLALAGFGPGTLNSSGYTGTLPVSRARGWRNPIASQYAVDDVSAVS
jgi:hypothetical protein